MYRRPRLLALAASVLMSAVSLSAAVVTKLPDDAFAPLRAAGIGQRITLDRLPIYDDKRSAIDLEEFQLWAPDAKVVIHGDNGVVLRKENPRPMRFFRGTVNGDPESFAYFSMDATGREIHGMVVTKDRRFSIATQHGRIAGRTAESNDVFLSTFDEADTIPMSGKTWECSVEEHGDKLRPPPAAFAASSSRRAAPQGISGTQQYAINVEIETDFELYQTAGNDSILLQAYIANLTGAVAAIYSRPPATGGLNTIVTLGNVHIYTSVSDPWSTKSSIDPNATQVGLGEVGNHYAGVRTTSNVVFLSGQAIGGGVAWTYVTGGSDFSSTCAGSACNGGPYAWCGDINVGAVPDPNSTTNGRLYGMPTNDYWPLAEYAHELGHNLAGTHTHCVAITDAERIAAGFTDGSPATSSSDFVDHCYANEKQNGCYGGATGLGLSNNYLAGSQTVFTGTIMSYCHNVFSGTGVPQSRYTFGLPTEPSHHELDDYMMNAAGPLNVGFGNNIVTAVGSFTISAVTAPASVVAGSTGNTASITAIPGATYAWSITPASAGTITSATTSNSITWTAGSAGTATVRVSAYSGTTKVGVSDFKLVTVTGGCAITMAPASGATIGAVSGVAVSQTVTSSGGVPPYTYTLTGTLPTGLSFNTSTGLLSGTTTQTGNFPVSIKSTDNAACNTTSSYTIHVAAACVSGDANADGVVNVGDVFFLINNLFAGGPNPPSAACANPNGIGGTTAADIFYLIKYLFAGGPAPI